MGLGDKLTASVGDDGVKINDIMVVTADVEADNGVIHVIGAVLMPPEGDAPAGAADSKLELPTDGADDAVATGEDGAGDTSKTIYDLATADAQFSTLAAAITAVDDAAPEGDTKLGDALMDADATLTVFAPNNDAINATLTDMGITLPDLLADLDKLRGILQYHVVPTKAMSTDLTDGQELETMDPEGGKIMVTVNDDGVSLNDGAAKVVKADIEASNGVIHVIDKVLMPPDDDADDAAADNGEDGGEEDGGE